MPRALSLAKSIAATFGCPAAPSQKREVPSARHGGDLSASSLPALLVQCGQRHQLGVLGSWRQHLGQPVGRFPIQCHSAATTTCLPRSDEPQHSRDSLILSHVFQRRLVGQARRAAYGYPHSRGWNATLPQARRLVVSPHQSDTVPHLARSYLIQSTSREIAPARNGGFSLETGAAASQRASFWKAVRCLKLTRTGTPNGKATG